MLEFHKTASGVDTHRKPSIMVTIRYSTVRLYGHVAQLPAISDSFPSSYEKLDHAERASTRSMVASGEVLSEGYGHCGPGVFLGDGQTEAE